MQARAIQAFVPPRRKRNWNGAIALRHAVAEAGYMIAKGDARHLAWLAVVGKSFINAVRPRLQRLMSDLA
ncbi:MAG: hypothetical protein JWP04_2780 [Belnapia sp.]|nr:hypothetical protein [Belnapia sp.]